MIEKLLWISGFLAAIALLFRGSVILGLYLGVVPGLLLAVAPSVFLYLAGFVALRWLARGALPGLWADAAALLAVAVIGVALALPGAIAGRRAYAAAATGDLEPSAPLRLAGHIKLERDPRTRRGNGRGCDALCAALLDTPGVLSVTLAGPDTDSVTYALGPQPEGVSMVPDDPGAIVEQLPARHRPAGPGGWQAERDARQILRDTVTARWALRAADGRGLVRVPAPARFDMTIASRDTLPAGRHRVAIAELIVRRGDVGDVLLRRQRVTAAPVAVPLHLWPRGGMMDQGFGIARSTLRSGARHAEIKPVEILFDQTNLARPEPDPAAAIALRARLNHAAADGVRGSELALVAPWLATLDWRKLDDADVALLGRLIADPGVRGLDRLYDGAASAVASALRPAIARRLRNAETDDQLRNRLNDLVRQMPPGTYATVLPDEAALLADPDLRLKSSALAGRLSDQGPAALPLIVRLLQDAADAEPWARRRWMIADLRRALARLGTHAAPALPLVSRLFEARPSPITNTWRDAENWRVAMVRMGRPVETLPFPDHLKPETLARDREQIARRAAGDVRDDD